MAPDSQQPATTAPPPGPAHARDKVRIRFRKGGDLRLVSHHDLMQCFERMLRRAALPFHATQGFNPKPRMVFALSLALGIVGCEEVVELELDEPMPPEEVHDRLARQAPAGLDILSVLRIDRKSSARVRRVCYRVALAAQQPSDLPERIAAVLAASECRVERTRGAWRTASNPSGVEKDRHPPPASHAVNLRPFVRDIRLSAGALEVDLWVTPAGTARPEEILGLLGLEDLLEAGAVLERTTLELYDETPETAPAPQPVERTGPPARADGPSRPRPSPLLPGPLSFDS